MKERILLALVAMIAFAAFALAMALTLSRPAAAQALCAPLPEMLAGLKKSHGETPVWTGRAGERRLVLTVSPGGTWTLIVVGPGGEPACMTGAGDEAKDPRGREI